MIPYRFKKFGWPALLLGAILSIDEFRAGWYSAVQGSAEGFEALWPWSIIPQLGNLGGLLIFLSLALFAFSKNEVDDEYLDSLRYRAFIVVFLVTALIGILIGEGLDVEMNIDLTILVFFQLLGFMIIFRIMKNFNLDN